MMKLKRLGFAAIAIAVASVSIFESCKKEYDLTKATVNDWNPDLAIPLVNSTFSIDDILKHTNSINGLSADNTGFLTLIYRGSLFSEQAKDIVQIPAQTIPALNYQLTVADAAAINALPNGTSPYNVNNLPPADFYLTPPTNSSSAFQIDTITISSGATYDVNANNSTSADIDLHITFNNLKSSTGAGFTQTVHIPAGGNASQSFSLSAMNLIPDNSGAQKDHLIISYSATLYKTGGTASAGQSLTVNSTLTNLNFSKFIGCIGQINTITPGADTVNISIFDGNSNEPGSKFTLKNPTMIANIHNGLGISIAAQFTKLDPYTPNKPITGINLLNTQAFSSAITVAPAANYVSSSTTSITASNANTGGQVGAFINSTPYNLIYSVNSTTNYQSSGYIRNFFLDTSRLSIDYDIIMPLEGTAYNFSATDTTPVSLGSDVTKLNKVNLRAWISNGYPVDMDVEIRFLDANNQLLFTVPETIGVTSIKSATVDPSTETVTAANVSTNNFTIQGANMAKLANAAKVVVHAYASTTNGGTQNVKIYNFYTFSLRLGLLAKPNAAALVHKK